MPEAEGEVAGPEAEPEGGRHVVTRSRAHDATARPTLQPRPGGARTSGSMRAPIEVGRHQSEQVVAVACLARRPPAGARSVAPVGRSGDPVSRHVSQSCGSMIDSVRSKACGFASPQPSQLGDGEAGDGHAAARSSPTQRGRAPRRAPRASGADSVSFHSLAGRSTSPSASSTTSPCCWPATATATGAIAIRHARLGAGHLERRPPVTRVLLAARRVRRRVRELARWPPARRCRRHAPRPCTPTSTSRPRPQGASAHAEQQLCHELVEALVAVALRGERRPRRTPH